MIAVVGATGFVGAALTTRLVKRPEPVRALVRDAGRARTRLGAAAADVELVVGDMHDDAALDALLTGVRAVYLLVQTVTTRQPPGTGDFAAVERDAADRLIAAATRAGVSRILTVGLIGARADAPNAWVRSRAALEQVLLESGLQTTVLRAGLVAGKGGVGFDGLLSAAEQRVALIKGNGRQRWSYIALADLVGYLVDALDAQATYGRVLDVGSAEAPTYRELLARTAHLQGRRAPAVAGIPLPLLRAAAPVLERRGGMARGGLRAAVDHLGDDLVGDPSAVAALLPRELLGWEDAVRAALRQQSE
jgi:uncharacterized protein YbjT (DUF2867 family)